MARSKRPRQDTSIGYADTKLGHILAAMRPSHRDKLVADTGIDVITLARASRATGRNSAMVPWIRHALTRALGLDADPLPPQPFDWNRPAKLQ